MTVINKDSSLLWVIDIQEKLLPKIPNYEILVKNTHWLMQLADECMVPIMIAQQYPEGLGDTIIEFAAWRDEYMNKMEFSAMLNPAMFEKLHNYRKNQIILVGIETHVCVLQTALDLIKSGFTVYVVVDAVGARNNLDHKYALKRMKQAGAILITKEMVFFEWLKTAECHNFKQLSKTYFPK
jgi:nicotinamidase-related amidase